MPCPSLRRFLRRSLLSVGVIPWLAVAATAAERGLPQITVFPAEVHKAGPQTFDLTQDARGILYFGNLQGLLSYDGAWWRLLKLPDEQAALSVAADAQGRVAVGMVSDFGTLERDATGAQTFRSLLSHLPEPHRAFGDVNAICAIRNGFLYVSERRLLVWDGRRARVAAEFAQGTAPRGCIAERGEVVLRGPHGLQRFDPITNRITAAGLTGARVLTALRRADGKIVAAVRGEGLFLVDGATATPFAPDASAWLQGKAVSGGSRLADGRLVITTR